MEETIQGIPKSDLDELFRLAAILLRYNSPYVFGIAGGASDPEPLFFHWGIPPGLKRLELHILFGRRSEARYRSLRNSVYDHQAIMMHEMEFVRCYTIALHRMSRADRELFNASGVECVRKNIGIAFTYHQPGWEPSGLPGDKVAACLWRMRQAIGMFLRAEDGGKPFADMDEDNDILLRTLSEEDGEASEEVVFASSLRDVEPVPATMPPPELIAAYNALPCVLDSAEFDVDLLYSGAYLLRERAKKDWGGRIPVCFLAAACYFRRDSNGGSSDEAVAAGSSLRLPGADLEGLWESVPRLLLEFFISHGCRAREIVVSSHRIMRFLRPLQRKVRFKLTYHAKLPAYSRVMAAVETLAISEKAAFEKKNGAVKR